MDTIWNDLRLAVRRLGTHRGYALGVVLIFGLGVGAATIVFSIVDAVLLAPLPYPHAEQIYQIHERDTTTGEGSAMAAATVRDLAASLETTDVLGVMRFDNYNLTGGAAPQQVRAAHVDRGYFAIFGAQPIKGRLFDAVESSSADRRVTVVGHALWQGTLGGDPNVIGRVLMLDGEPSEVIGVLPASFDQPSWADLWVPAGALTGDDRSRRALSVYARLGPTSNAADVGTELAVLSARLATDHPDTHADHRLMAESLHDLTVGTSRGTLVALFAAVLALMLIVCLNVAGLELARGLERRRELAVRTALGAGRGRVIRQLLVENLLLTLFGGALGLTLAVWGLDLVVGWAPGAVPRLDEAAVNLTAVGFAVVMAFVAALVFGWLPSMRATSFAVYGTLKAGSESAPNGRSLGLRPALVVAQVALSLVLLIGAGLLGRSFQALLSVDLGFDADRLMNVGVVLPPDQFPEGHQKMAWMTEVQGAIQRVPGVDSVSLANFPLLSPSGSRVALTADGSDTGERVEPVTADVRVVGSGFFETMAVSLRAGRLFDQRDDDRGPATAVVSERLAQRVWGDRSPVGQRISYTERGVAVTADVVGVVVDAHWSGPTLPPSATVFRPYAQEPWSYVNLLVRWRGEATADGTTPVQQAVWSVDADRPLFAVAPLATWLDGYRGRPRFSALLSAVFSLFALLLAAVGLYGVMAFSVQQRRKEIGIRLALGARVGEVRRMVVRRGMTLALVGIVLGLVGGLVATRWLESLLFEVEALDVLTISVVVGVLLAASFAASYLPALRATRIDPVRTLRQE